MDIEPSRNPTERSWYYMYVLRLSSTNDNVGDSFPLPNLIKDDMSGHFSVNIIILCYIIHPHKVMMSMAIYKN